MEHSLEIECIITGAVWIITLPFYIYALLKWRQFSGHFLIQKRFPKLSYILFVIAFFGQTIWLIEKNLHVHGISHDTIHHHIRYFVFSLTFTISGLVLYRINLVYLKWKSLQPAASQILTALNNHSNSSTICSVPQRKNNVPSMTVKKISITKRIDKNASKQPVANVYGSRLSIIILYFVFIGSVIAYLSYSLSPSLYISYLITITQFTALWIFICCSIFIIKYNKVTEGIGCIKECYAILISLIVQMAFNVICQFNHTMYLLSLQYTTYFVLHFQAIVTLYIPLALLLKAEGTLNVKQFHDKTDNKVFQDGIVCTTMDVDDNNNNIDTTEIVYGDNNNRLAVIIDDKNNNNNTDNKQPNDSNNGCKLGSIFVRKCLFQFLYRNPSNHCVFSDYLRFCFAIENLLFVERVSIFYQIVFKLQLISKIRNRSKKSSSNCSKKISASYDILNVPELDLSHTVDNNKYPELSAIDISRLSSVCTKEKRNGIINVTTNNTNGTDSTANTPKSLIMITPMTPIPNGPTFGDLKSSKDKDINKDVNKPKNGLCAGLKYIYRFEFRFLKDIYEHYDNIITETIISDDDKPDNNQLEVTRGTFDISVHKAALFQICKEIYIQYISLDAVNQVNLSHEVYQPLQYLLGEDGGNIDKFQSYDDFLTIFDGAVVETYRLMINVYGYQFREFVRNRYHDAKFE